MLNCSTKEWASNKSPINQISCASESTKAVIRKLIEKESQIKKLVENCMQLPRNVSAFARRGVTKASVLHSYFRRGNSVHQRGARKERRKAGWYLPQTCAKLNHIIIASFSRAKERRDGFHFPHKWGHKSFVSAQEFCSQECNSANQLEIQRSKRTKLHKKFKNSAANYFPFKGHWSATIFCKKSNGAAQQTGVDTTAEVRKHTKCRFSCSFQTINDVN